MFGSDYNDTKTMMQDLADVSAMYSKAKPTGDEGIMKAPQGDQIDAGSWWAWLSGATRQKAQENAARVQEELSKMGVNTEGTSSQYNQELLDGILQARQYRDKWGITESLSDKPKWLEEQGDFPIPEQSEVTTEELPSMDEEASLFDRLSNIRYVRSDNEEVIDVSPSAEAADQQGIMSKPKPKHLKEKVKAPTKEELISSVFKAEGGYSTDKNDKGNYYKGQFVGTNHGISAPILAQSLGRTPTVADMKALTKEKAKKIAGQHYYDRFKIDTLPEDVQEIVFHAVYMGESRGVRAMQNLMGLTPDGVMGPKTKAAMRNAKFTKEEFKDEYLRELKEGTEGYSKPASTWNKHGKGWTNRYNKLAK